MTDPVATPSSPLPSIITAAMQEAIDQARALGLTWSLRMATVLTSTPLTIVYDGDTVVVNAVSMIGTPAQGARVYVLFVPPSGNFITGATQQVTRYIGCNYSTAGGFGATSTGSEVAFTAWSIEDNMTFAGGRLYRIDVELAPNYSGNDVAWATYRIRQGSQTVSGQLLALFFVHYTANLANFGYSNKQYCFIKNRGTSPVRTRLSLTVTKVIGAAGSFSIYGGEVDAPTTLVVQDIGDIVDNPSIALFARPLA